MEKNNIFNYATSELSQDAFICWCLNWLNYKDSELRSLAVDLLKEFGEKNVSDNQEILVKKQFENIDILVVLNKLNRVYIIEDKVNASEREEQTEKYKNKIKELPEDKREVLKIDKDVNIDTKTIYFKTGFHFSVDKNVKADKIITGKTFKGILEKYRHKNEIIDSYYEYLEKKLQDEENEKDYLECKSESHWDWNIAKSNIAQYCFLEKIFLEKLEERKETEERIRSFKNKGNGSVVSHYNLLGEDIPIGKTEEKFSIFWRVDTGKDGTYLRLNFYYKYKKDDKISEKIKISEEKYEDVYKKIYNVIEKYKDKLQEIYRMEKKCKYKKNYEIPILHINLKKFIEAGKTETNKLINEVKELHNFLQNENFE